MLVAPVKVGDGAVTGAGSVVTKDVPPDSLVYGAPAKVKRNLNEPEKEPISGKTVSRKKKRFSERFEKIYETNETKEKRRKIFIASKIVSAEEALKRMKSFDERKNYVWNCRIRWK
jgi:acyl-[acyl carrier protein]--UDP-N-acetylglucosamine O-acyltransferase